MRRRRYVPAADERVRTLRRPNNNLSHFCKKAMYHYPHREFGLPLRVLLLALSVWESEWASVQPATSQMAMPRHFSAKAVARKRDKGNPLCDVLKVRRHAPPCSSLRSTYMVRTQFSALTLREWRSQPNKTAPRMPLRTSTVTLNCPNGAFFLLFSVLVAVPILLLHISLSAFGRRFYKFQNEIPSSGMFLGREKS